MTARRIAVVDYGMGNLHSMAKALEHVAGGADIVVSDDPAVIRAADKVVFPGVGAIRDCMAELLRRGLDDVVRDAVATRPVLAVCIGMQALLESSEENGGTVCLGIVQGTVRHFGAGLVDEHNAMLKVPHMGWNRVRMSEHPLWQGIEQHSRFYFVHSYYAAPVDQTQVSGVCAYGIEFAAALARDSLFAVQFHPEKSHTAGLRLLANFAAWDGRC